MQKAIFLDRDGVINYALFESKKPLAPREVQEFHIIPEFRAFYEELRSNYLFIVVTNQPDVGNGFVEQNVIESMHNRLKKEFLLDAVYACFHSQSAGCNCRKPRPGMIQQACEEFSIDLTKSFLIGDRFGDIKLANDLNITSILLGDGYGEKKISTPIYIVKNLHQAKKIILDT